MKNGGALHGFLISQSGLIEQAALRQTAQGFAASGLSRGLAGVRTISVRPAAFFAKAF